VEHRRRIGSDVAHRGINDRQDDLFDSPHAAGNLGNLLSHQGMQAAAQDT
jgi:hypothetical protein